MRMRIVEGQYGTVQAFVVPQATPCICKAAVHAIKPLCMHHRINSWDDSTAMNELLITGTGCETLQGLQYVVPCRLAWHVSLFFCHRSPICFWMNLSSSMLG